MSRPRCPRCSGWLFFDGVDLDCLMCGSMVYADPAPDGLLYRIDGTVWFLPRPKPAWPTEGIPPRISAAPAPEPRPWAEKCPYAS